MAIWDAVLITNSNVQCRIRAPYFVSQLVVSLRAGMASVIPLMTGVSSGVSSRRKDS